VGIQDLLRDSQYPVSKETAERGGQGGAVSGNDRLLLADQWQYMDVFLRKEMEGVKKQVASMPRPMSPVEGPGRKLLQPQAFLVVWGERGEGWDWAYGFRWDRLRTWCEPWDHDQKRGSNLRGTVWVPDEEVIACIHNK